jgi:putative Mg2+ transporter-C (MgtC) family protein
VGQEIRAILEGFPDLQHLERVVVRLVMAALLGGVIGYERHMEQKAAGTRTHMLVALGSALFVLMPLEAGMSKADMSRIIQGIATGIGFLGAGTIIKVGESHAAAEGHTKHEVRGLTTAAGIWLTAAVGLAAGAGWIWPAVIGVALTWTILSTLHTFEHWLRNRGRHEEADRISGGGQA